MRRKKRLELSRELFDKMFALKGQYTEFSINNSPFGGMYDGYGVETGIPKFFVYEDQIECTYDEFHNKIYHLLGVSIPITNNADQVPIWENIKVKEKVKTDSFDIKSAYAQLILIDHPFVIKAICN